MMEAGSLPNFRKLRDAGSYKRLATTAPAQTPVAWSTFATGANPGVHGIFDFLHRDPRHYRPDLALTRYERRSALLPPQAINLRSGTTMWEVLANAGVPSTILRCPCTYPPTPFTGRLLAGMGVPDLRGGIGTASFFSTQPPTPRESESVALLEQRGDRLVGTLKGPRRAPDDDATVAFTLAPDASANTATLSLGERHPGLTLKLGHWSQWQRVSFRTGLLTKVSGLVRFLLCAVAPHVELYASPINFDPRTPPFPISHPPAYAGDLEDAIGPYATLGMPEDHTGLTNGRFDEDAFLSQCDLVMHEREAMLRYELGRLERGLLFCLFDTPDRIQHMFWRFREPDHPANDVHGYDARYANVIDDHYQRCDAILGEVLRSVDDRTFLMVLSDHGFGSFRRAVNLNAWLADTGWLALRPGADRSAASTDFFRQVDWSRTRAYALGFGGIYLNVNGREVEGIVSADAREAEATRLAGELTGLVDRKRGVVALRGAETREQLYAGPRMVDAPDVLVRCASGYRASWGTALGGVPESWFEDNTRKWAGDHIVDPLLVPGVLFMNRSIRKTAAHLVDCAPTILDALGLPAQSGREGRSLMAY